MDLKRLTPAERAIAGGGAAFLLSTLLPWFRLEALGAGHTATGWDVGFIWGVLPALASLALVTHVVLARLVDGVELGQLPRDRLQLGAGALVVLPVLTKVVFGYSTKGYAFHRAFGLWCAALAAIVVAAGCYSSYRESA